MNMDAKGLTKYQQTKANNTEGSYTTAKVDSSQSHKDGSTYANQPTWSITTKEKTKTTWSSQQMQKNIW